MDVEELCPHICSNHVTSVYLHHLVQVQPQCAGSVCNISMAKLGAKSFNNRIVFKENIHEFNAIDNSIKRELVCFYKVECPVYRFNLLKGFLSSKFVPKI
jgi:hypothetical protein